MKVVVILPTYNERENILVLLDRIRTVVQKIKSHSFLYLIVDDNSPDGTSETVKSYQKKYKDVFLVNGKKEGLGKALLKGMNYAVDKLDAEILVQMDADLSHNPEAIPKMLEAIDNGADFVVGSRYIPGGSIPNNWGLQRKIFSIMGNAVVRFGLGFPAIHDWTGGYRVYKRIYFEKIAPQMGEHRGYVYQIAFLHKAQLGGAKIVEVPINFSDRKYGISKIVFSEYIKKIFEYIITAKIDAIRNGSFGKFLVVGTIGFIINTVILELAVRFGLHPALGSAIGAEIAIISNFILNNNWTFNQHKIEGKRQIFKFLQFNLTSLGAVIIQSGTVWIGVYLTNKGLYRLWYIVGVGIGLVWNYFMYSRVIWRKK
jgi:dolichol-phosphate mannosyltransferase